MSANVESAVAIFRDKSLAYQCLAFLTVAALAIYGLYQWLLPTPIPGIAYNPEAARSILGDTPAMLKEVSVTGEFRVWCAKQVHNMGSPICQIFIRPFSQPWVLVADFREARDILMRRREFDKSSFLSDGMACMGNFHGIYMTNEKFKSNRQLIQDLMTTTFLNNHVGPAVYGKGIELVRLLERKMLLANGRSFSVKKDFEYVSLDVMIEFAFGKNWKRTALGQQVELIEKLESAGIEHHAKVDPLDQAASFPLNHLEGFLYSVHEAPEIVEKTINAIVPKLQTWWWSKQPWYQKIFTDKEEAMKIQVDIGVSNFRAGKIQTGVEHMLMREASRAEKDGREPDFDSKVFRDELFGDIVGGHHTTSGAMMWLTKYITDVPHVQDKLRSVLLQAFVAAKQEGRCFTFPEIRQARLPYLDAVLEEMLRINAVPVTREALCDTTILGCPIKKGTQVFFVSNGPGFLSPSLPLDESRRSEPSLKAKLHATWDEQKDLSRFEPERWLIRKKDGQGVTAEEVEFDGAAGPQLVFGLGPRACWGRRLALMEIKVVIAMLVWNFELLQSPRSLSGYAGLEGIARVPQQCYVKLKKL